MLEGVLFLGIDSDIFLSGYRKPSSGWSGTWNGSVRGMGQGAALLTDAIEVGAQRVVREVLLPQAGRQELHFEGRMRIHAL